jgi:hypothetical protein
MSKKWWKSDPYWKASERVLRGTDAELGRVQGDLNSYVAAGDKDSAASAVAELANLSRQKENLVLLRNQYLQSRTPQQQAPKTAEETAATPIQNMNANELMELYRGSKYSRDLDWNDPNVRAGWIEAQNRRARGE